MNKRLINERSCFVKNIPFPLYLEHERADKILVFKKKRRKNYRRKHGHRQHLTSVRITEILTGGKKPSKAAAKPAPAKKDEKAEAKKPDYAALGRKGGKRGGKARAEKLSPERRREIARKAAHARWQKTGSST